MPNVLKPPQLRTHPTQVLVPLPRDLWYAFRVACRQHQRSARQELRRVLRAQVTAWDTHTQQETDHA